MVYLKRLWLQDFRNYSAQETGFKKGTNVIFGQNGQEKTNLLEAIYYMGSAASLRRTSGASLRKQILQLFVLKSNTNGNLVEAEISNQRQKYCYK